MHSTEDKKKPKKIYRIKSNRWIWFLELDFPHTLYAHDILIYSNTQTNRFGQQQQFKKKHTLNMVRWRREKYLCLVSLIWFWNYEHEHEHFRFHVAHIKINTYTYGFGLKWQWCPFPTFRLCIHKLYWTIFIWIVEILLRFVFLMHCWTMNIQFGSSKNTMITGIRIKNLCIKCENPHCVTFNVSYSAHGPFHCNCHHDCAFRDEAS